MEVKRATIAWAPTSLLIGTFCLAAGIVEHIPIWAEIAVVLATGITSLSFLSFDKNRKTVELQYDLEESAKGKFNDLCLGLSALSSCGKLWRVATEQAVLDSKYAAGANKTIERKNVSASRRSPRWISTNVEVWSVKLDDQSLYFLPDRILVVDRKHLGDVEYHEIEIGDEETRFVESSDVPFDTEVIEQTWTYTNRNGGPDRRFAYNPQLPIVRYKDISLRSPEGLNLLFQASSAEKAQQFISALRAYTEETRSKQTLKP